MDCSGLPDRTTLRHFRATIQWPRALHCSGLPDRTTLRPEAPPGVFAVVRPLFRSSRPDYIETSQRLFRRFGGFDCSGLPDRTTLRLAALSIFARVSRTLFRSSRPDYIETFRLSSASRRSWIIVPVFQTGLH